MVRGILETGDSPASTSVDKIVATFNKYKDQSTGSIEVEGIQKFFEDSEISDPSDILTILISSKMNALNMGTFT